MGMQGRHYVEERYNRAIAYYWAMGGRNKLAYKWSRYLTIVLGATVTLVASLSSAKLSDGFGTTVAIATPLLAATLTMIGGFSQSFQWGASWREMVLTAERLEAERDRLAVTPDGELDLRRELDLLNRLVQRESSGFFDRVMGSSMAMADDRQPEAADAPPLQAPPELPAPPQTLGAPPPRTGSN
jgi:hypothetical protein